MTRWDRYSEALPLLQQAVPALAGAGPEDLYEGYADYNLGYTLLQLGECKDAKHYLVRAKRLEPDRTEVDAALDAARGCGHGGKGKGKDKGKAKENEHEQD